MNKRIKITSCKDLSTLKILIGEWAEECHTDDFGLIIDFDEVDKDFTELMVGQAATLLVMTQEDYGLEIPIGFMGIRIFKSPIGHELIANEHYWFVSKGHRGINSIRLLEAAIQWAKNRGAHSSMFNASCLASDLHDAVCSIYERAGMKKFETTYIMKI